MATKTDLQANIATINDGGVNTALEVRTLHENELENSYADKIVEQHGSNVITTQTADTNFYNVTFCKQGRKVSIIGNVTSKQISITSTTSFFEIIDPEFYPDVTLSINHRIYGRASNDNREIKLKFSSNKLILDGSALSLNQSVYLEFEYLTQD